MRHFPSQLLLVVALLSVGFLNQLVNAAPGSKETSYIVGKGDKLKIQILHEDDMTVELSVSDTGEITYPLLGEVSVAGLNNKQIAEAITKGLKGPYYVNPTVVVFVIEYRNIFVQGQVRIPGGYAFRPGLTVQQALVAAGGLTERADTDDLTIVRESGTGVRTEFAVVLGSRVEPGDVITVGESFF
ncbi:polysaccharide export protein [Methylolobus aquaticus]|nr:polysaccharide export protein [Methylolobus aquaticus]